MLKNKWLKRIALSITILISLILIFYGVLAILGIRQNPLYIYARKLLWKISKPQQANYNEVLADKLPTLACTDLGAYYKDKPNNLKGINAVVIMEDRIPEFFLSYNNFEPNKDTGLNRHGPLKELKTQTDLKNIVSELHSQNIKVYFGFWCYRGTIFERNWSWLKNHPEVNALPWVYSYFDPLVNLEKEKMSFAEYVGKQYEKLQKDFNFDGLFLGDGSNGYGRLTNIYDSENKAVTSPKWAEFYKTIAKKVHETGGKLLAYDILGFAPEQAKLHGADYKAEAEAGLDYLVVQTYPVAFGQFWEYGNKGFDLASCLDHFQKTKEALKDTNCQAIYTLELGDAVEGWYASKNDTISQLLAFQNIASGKLLVWANKIFANKNK